jgi:hypothetical protein
LPNPYQRQLVVGKNADSVVGSQAEVTAVHDDFRFIPSKQPSPLVLLEPVNLREDEERGQQAGQWKKSGEQCRIGLADGREQHGEKKDARNAGSLTKT